MKDTCNGKDGRKLKKKEWGTKREKYGIFDAESAVVPVYSVNLGGIHSFH